MNNLKSYFNLPRNIYILFFSRIINCIGSFVFPLLAILLTKKLGFSNEAAGTFTTVTIAISGLGMLIGGKLSDKFGRRKIIIISSFIGGLFFLSCAFLKTSPITAYMILLGDFFSTLQYPATTAMLSDLTDKENRQKAFSLLYLGTNIGIAIGPLIAGFLIDSNLMLFFLFDSITTFLSLILIIIFIKETLPKKEDMLKVKEDDAEKQEHGNILKVLLRRPFLLIFAFVSIFFSFSYIQYAFSLPLFVNSLFVKSGPQIYGFIMTTNAVTVILCTIFITVILQKLKPIINIAIAGLFFAIGFGMLYFTKTIFFLIMSTIIWTLGEIIITINTRVFVANNTPVSHRGRFNAIIDFISESGFALGPIIAGYFIAAYNIENIWVIIFFISVLGSIMMLALFIFAKIKKRDI